VISLIILIIVFVFIAVREITTVRLKIFEITLSKLKIWEIMLLGSIGVIITQQISIKDAIYSINLEVILFLFCMFVIGVALEESGYLEYISFHLFKKARNKNDILLILIFVMGLLSALLMNDTIAIIGTPIVIHLARNGLNIKPLLLALAFSVTIGSLTSPIGNPQNFLIATQLENPFINFFKYLLVPTLINLFISYLIIKYFFKKDFIGTIDTKKLEESIRDYKLAHIAKLSIILLIVLIIFKVILGIVKPSLNLPLISIIIVSTIPVLFFSERRFEIVKKVDWHTLIFFVSMFILMQSVWNTGIFQSLIKESNINIYSIPSIFIISVILSQFISNVPLVILYLPLIADIGSIKEIISLAAGSTIAGNLLILGAASNVIIIHNAEKRSGIGIGFFEFAKIGIPLTIVNVLIYFIFLKLF